MRRNIITVGSIVALLIFVGLASAVWPNLSGGGSLDIGFGLPSFDTSVNTVMLPDALVNLMPSGLQEQVADGVNELLLFLIITVIVGAVVVGAGLPLVFVYARLDKMATETKADDSYVSGRKQIDQRVDEQISQYKKEQPPTPVPSHARYGWSAISTTLVTMVLLAFTGAAVNENFAGGEDQFLWSVIFMAIGLLGGLLFFNRKQMKATDDADNEPINWGSVWVVTTGIILLGIGLGIMMWVRSQGA